MPELNPRVTRLVCVTCGADYAPNPNLTVCDDCGLTDGILDVEYDLEHIPRGDDYLEVLLERAPNHFRYRELLPTVPDDPRHFLRVGWTPIYQPERLASALGLEQLHLKDDGLNPTASFKDRASSVGVVMAQVAGAKVISCASTGNAASSLSGMAAHVGLDAVILVPARAPAPKVAQLRTFGATVLRVDAEYSAVWDLCQALIEREGFYNRNCAVNAYLVEGKKTAGLELGEQLAGQRIDWVAVSVGDGCTIAGIEKGLRHMVELEVLPSMPRVLGVQAETAAAVHHAFMGTEPTGPAETFADSICVSVPRNMHKALRALRRSKGATVTISDAEIEWAMTAVPRLSGVFVEPAAAATAAGIRTAVEKGIIARDATVAAIMTGNGLKDISSAQRIAGDAPVVESSLEAVGRALAEQRGQ